LKNLQLTNLFQLYIGLSICEVVEKYEFFVVDITICYSSNNDNVKFLPYK